MNTHHITVAVTAPERAGRGAAVQMLQYMLSQGQDNYTVGALAAAAHLEHGPHTDNNDLALVTTSVITEKRPPLPAPVLQLLRAARAAARLADEGVDVDTVTFSIDGRVFLYDSWNFKAPSFMPQKYENLSDLMDQATSFVAASYPLPVTFEWPDSLLDDTQKDSLAQLAAAIQQASRDGSLKKLAERVGLQLEQVSGPLGAIDQFLKEQS